MKTPLYLLRNIERVSTREDLTRYALEVAAMVETMVWGGLNAVQVGPVVSRLNDALVARFLRLAEDDLGGRPSPTPGSSSDPKAAWSRPCSPTRTTRWSTPTTASRRATTSGARTDRVRALVAAAFPPLLRRVHGDQLVPAALVVAGALPGLDREARAARAHRGAQLLRLPRRSARSTSTRCSTRAARRPRADVHGAPGARLAGAAAAARRFRHIRETDDGVDLKKGGLAPIVSLARLYALEARCARAPRWSGSRAPPTPAR